MLQRGITQKLQTMNKELTNEMRIALAVAHQRGLNGQIFDAEYTHDLAHDIYTMLSKEELGDVMADPIFLQETVAVNVPTFPGTWYTIQEYMPHDAEQGDEQRYIVLDPRGYNATGEHMDEYDAKLLANRYNSLLVSQSELTDGIYTPYEL